MQFKQQLRTCLVCLMLLFTAGGTLADGNAWARRGYDEERTSFYPYGSQYEISFEDFTLLWFAQVSPGLVLTGDIDGDGGLEVVTWDGQKIDAFDRNGQHLWGVAMPNATFGGLLLSDVTGDGISEIIAAGRPSSNQLQMRIYDGAGNLLKIINRPGGNDSRIRPWFAGDLDSDGNIEILATVSAGYSKYPRGVLLFDYETGQELWYYAMGPYIGLPAVGDIGGDGNLEVISANATVHNGVNGCGVNGQGTCTNDSRVYSVAMDAGTGSELYTSTHSSHGHGQIDYAFADMDQDGGFNVIGLWGHDPTYYPGPLKLFVLDEQGTMLDEWDGPQNKSPVSWAIADVDGDGFLEAILCDRQWLTTGNEHYSLRIVDDDLDQQIAVNDDIVNVRNNGVNVYAADLNGDQINDILVTDMKNGKFRILDNSLAEIWSFDVSNLRGLALSDLNDDGIPEIILAADSLLVLSAPIPIVSVHTDIKPGSCPNPLNITPYHHLGIVANIYDSYSATAKVRPDGPVRGKDVVPVTIDGTDDFNVLTIDPETVQLEGVSPLRWHISDVSTPVGADAEECECDTQGADGISDLTMKFDKAAIIEALGEVSNGDTIQLTITGELYDGTSIEGHDCVIIRSNGSEGEGDGYDSDNTSARSGSDQLPSDFCLYQNRPNPFNPITEINLGLPVAADVTLEVFNIAGQRVATLADGQFEAGNYSFVWDGSDQASGMYLYRLKAGEFVETKKMMLLK